MIHIVNEITIEDSNNRLNLKEYVLILFSLTSDLVTLYKAWVRIV
jgi:hypothetical protein